MQTIEEFRATKNQITADEFETMSGFDLSGLVGDPAARATPHVYVRHSGAETWPVVIIDVDARFEWGWCDCTDYSATLEQAEIDLFASLTENDA